jgi:hypothetical protein
MVHAFCGVVISYIDEDWVLHESVVDLIPLDGDHSGKAVGRLVFKRLKKYKAAGDICEDAFFSSLILGNHNLARPTMHPAMDHSTSQLRRGVQKSTLTHPAREISKSDAVAMLRTSWLSQCLSSL